MKLRVGLSTCPNDTFLFAGLLEGRVSPRGLELEFVLGDVQELNVAVAAGELDVSKASFASALELADRYGVLTVGSALGFGVGPVLLTGSGGPTRLDPGLRVLCPGEGTTATLLLRCLHPELVSVEHRRFDEIMPAIERGEADVGVCIHEGRFTYAERGLTLLEDLGRSWETLTGLPVPLGGLLARRELPDAALTTLVSVLGDSLRTAWDEPGGALDCMRRHAQELDDDVLWKHVELYVNQHTADLGDVGRRCLEELARRAGTARRLVILPRARSTSPG